ncbi:MAG: hypothetical protein HYY95_06205 [Candidatus Rokubacteria bacterium]|nr:hypothetical protein [Candidatus Rokubacteria bacterium]MBI3105154.1 hypothetical protein [Candidatus Rokubacteria bacterium]
MTRDGAFSLVTWLRGVVFLSPLALAAFFILAPAGFGLSGGLMLPGARVAEADNPPVTVGLDTAFGITRVVGLPLRTFSVGGDQFWVYQVRAAADEANVKRLTRAETDLERSATGTVTLDRVSVLRFDGTSKLLKAVYLR